MSSWANRTERLRKNTLLSVSHLTSVGPVPGLASFLFARNRVESDAFVVARDGEPKPTTDDCPSLCIKASNKPEARRVWGLSKANYSQMTTNAAASHRIAPHPHRASSPKSRLLVLQLMALPVGE